MDNARLFMYCFSNDMNTEVAFNIIDYFYEFIFREELYEIVKSRVPASFL